MERVETFAVRQERAIEEERRRLAREVHDQLGQYFTGLKLMVRAWSDRFPDDPTTRENLRHFMEQLDTGVATARRIASELRPPMLDDLGLGAALGHYAPKLVASAGVTCDVTLSHDELLGRDQANALFRIAQEALTNIMRHANARTVKVYDRKTDDGDYLFCIDDDGAGFLPAALEDIGSTGLMGMSERARLVGGRLELANAGTGGACVCVRLPLVGEKADQCTS